MVMQRWRGLQAHRWMCAAWTPIRITSLWHGSSRRWTAATPSWATLWTGQSLCDSVFLKKDIMSVHSVLLSRRSTKKKQIKERCDVPSWDSGILRVDITCLWFSTWLLWFSTGFIKDFLGGAYTPFLWCSISPVPNTNINASHALPPKVVIWMWAHNELGQH